MDISGNLLRGDIKQDFVSGKDSGEFRPGLPDTIVIHYTAGPTADSAIHTFRDSGTKASAHVIIDTDGSIIQVIPFNKIAWHAGVSRWKQRNNLNQFSIGIEIVNAGNLEPDPNGFKSWFGRIYPESEVVQMTHPQQSKPTFWHKYTDAQIKAVFELCSVLAGRYNITEIVGHYDISPGRKLDPGPAFPMQELRDKILKPQKGPKTKSQGGVVTASSLNFRSAPSASSETLTNPLPKGTKVEVLEENGDWYKVEYKLKGWVAKRFVESAQHPINQDSDS